MPYPQMLRFIYVGGFASCLYAILAFALNGWFHFAALSASIVAYCLAGICSYFIHRRFTFASSNDMTKEIGRFVLATLVGLSLSIAIPLIMAERAPYQVFLTVLLVVPVTSFLMMKFFVFIKNENQS